MGCKLNNMLKEQKAPRSMSGGISEKESSGADFGPPVCPGYSLLADYDPLVIFTL